MVYCQPRVGGRIDAGKQGVVAAMAARREDYPGRRLDYLVLFVFGSSGG